jgi:hypothetical protein
MLKCSTSLWSADLTNLAAEMKRVEPYSERFHLDVADGHYVKNLLFFPDLVAQLRKHTGLPFEVHLMVTDPLGWIDPFVEAGADVIIFCFDSAKDPGEILRAIKARGKQAGVSLLITESVDLLAPYWNDVDIVTIVGTAMGIKGADGCRGAGRSCAPGESIEQSGLKVEIFRWWNSAETVASLRAVGALHRTRLAHVQEDPRDANGWHRCNVTKFEPGMTREARM